MTSDRRIRFREDPEVLQARGREFLSKIAVCFKLAMVHDLSNDALVEPVAELAAFVNRALAHTDGKLSFQRVSGSFFVDRVPVKLDLQGYETGQTLTRVFERLELGGLTFTAPLAPERWLAFLAVFQRHAASGPGSDFAAEQFPGVTIHPVGEEAARVAEAVAPRWNVLRSFGALELAVGHALERLALGQPLRVAPLRRALHRMADAAAGLEPLLVAITRHRHATEPLAFNLVSVAALTLAMGRRLGLPRPDLSELCLAALLHELPRGEPDPERARLETTLNLCTLTLSMPMLGYVCAAFEHRLPAAGAQGLPPGQVARIVAVPAAFQRLAGPWAGRRGLPADRALQIVIGKAGTWFDPAAVQLFVETVGFHPLGSVVELSTGDLAIVVAPPVDPAYPDRPSVQIAVARTTDPGRVVDLMAHGVTVARGVDPLDAGVDVLAHLFG